MDINNIGRKGEVIVEKILIAAGYKILSRNKRFGRSEFDVIASKNNKIFVIEVKTRSNNYYGSPEEAVTQDKLNKFCRCYEMIGEEYNNFNIIYVIAAVLYDLKENKCTVKFIKVS